MQQTDQDLSAKFGAVMLHVVQPPAVAEASFEHVQKLAREARMLRKAFYDSSPGSMAEDNLMQAYQDAQDRYRKACDEFFLNAAERGQ